MDETRNKTPWFVLDRRTSNQPTSPARRQSRQPVLNLGAKDGKTTRHAHAKRVCSVRLRHISVSIGSFGARINQTLVALLLVSVLTGCQTRGTHYYAHEIPGDVVALPNSNAQTIDFSRLSGSPPNSELIGPGDLLEVTIAVGIDTRSVMTFPVRVNQDGIADVNEIGTVRLAGFELDEAEGVISQASRQRGLFKNPHVTVNMKRKRMNRIMVVGAVKDPGLKSVPASESSLLSVLFAAGGLAEDAGTTVQIRNLVENPKSPAAIAGRPETGILQTGYSNSVPNSARVDLVKATEEGTNAYFIGDGGVVMVEKRDPKAIHVIGLVRTPGKVDFPVNKDLRLFDALALAGYTSTQVANKVFVFRNSPTQGWVRIQCSLSRAKSDETHNVLLAPGDVVSVENTPATVLLEALQIIRIGVSGSVNPLL
jgi:polysaccharide biosynthesis/export protein